TDPLNIVIGNPGLRQEFRNSFNLHYNNYKVLSERYLGVHVNYSKSDRAISSSDLVQPGGKRIIQAVNVDGNQDMSLYSYFSRRLPKSEWSAGVDLSMNYSLTNNFVNLVKNRNKYSRINLGINQRKQVKDKFSIQISEGASYFVTRSSINPDAVTEYFTYQLAINGSLELPWKLTAETSVIADYREKTTAFDRNRDVIRWDMNLSRKFFKGDKGELRLDVKDLLNQSIGFERTTSSNFISENTYDTFTRYLMLRFIYRFTKTPGADPAK
ncbi:MAG TPA: outer membrane beta-barrel protein, partial [Flavitalea sp.]|nr:outer membrane beta-barrel protein [Flavitalea sp.]